MGAINLTREERGVLADQYDQNRRTFERILSRDLNAFFAGLGLDVFASLSVNRTQINFSDYISELEAILLKSYRKTGGFFSSHIQRLLKELTPKSQNHEESINQIQNERTNIEAALLLLLLASYKDRARRQAGFILNTTRRIFRETLANVLIEMEMQERELSSQEIAKAHAKKFNERNKRRVRTIAETEVGNISQLAIQAESDELSKAIILAGIIIRPSKTWLTVGDSRVRRKHRNANNQKRKLKDPYLVGGERLMFPGDTSLGASLGNIMNCRCSSITEL